MERNYYGRIVPSKYNTSTQFWIIGDSPSTTLSRQLTQHCWVRVVQDAAIISQYTSIWSGPKKRDQKGTNYQNQDTNMNKMVQEHLVKRQNVQRYSMYQITPGIKVNMGRYNIKV